MILACRMGVSNLIWETDCQSLMLVSERDGG
uniref:Uncharacterized protein n=1 Tax=Arundo donax TaxID=35708 RepID=A0A0A8YU28_ARUDO